MGFRYGPRSLVDLDRANASAKVLKKAMERRIVIEQEQEFVVAPYHEFDSWYGMPSTGPSSSHPYSWHGWVNYVDPHHQEEQYFHCRDKPALVWHPSTIHHLDKAPEIVGETKEEYYLYNISMTKEAFNNPYIVKELTKTYEPKLRAHVEFGLLLEKPLPRKSLVTIPVVLDKEERNYKSKLKGLAHQLWIERGCPEGSPEVDWEEAKRRLGVST